MEEKKEQTHQEDSTQDLKSKIIQALKTCYDPEIPVDIYELGLIYDIAIDDSNNVYIKMTLTSPACPAATFLPGQVEDRVRAIPEVNDVKVDVVWEPPWNPDMMSDVARFELGMM
ncbi:MAG: SUF system Fe-S cluster assembly protein [Calditrichaeota bacterium]|nr:MAG: SUF system Fe-S cluster assembly protein [Calditrichota bacterium]